MELRFFLIKNNITYLQKKKMIVHDKKNHLKLEEKERESTFFQLKEWQPMAITTWLKHQYCL